MKLRNILFVSIFSALLVLLSGCVRQPTSKENTVDDRPALSFKLQSGKALTAGYVVFVDNLDMGTANRYVSGRQALRVLSGSHLIRIEKDGVNIYETNIYVGDGAVKEIIIP